MSKRPPLAWLSERYGALLRDGLEAGQAERRAFEELVAQREFAPAAWPTLYEDFLRVSGPEARRGHGVYFTPAALVGAQVRLVESVLRERLGCAAGFGDPRVLVVDPAAGSGAYPLAVRERTKGRQVRMRLFEAMPGAVVLARSHGLEVQETDALAIATPLEAPIVVCLGNPPYRRRSGSPRARAALAGFTDSGDGVHRKNLYNDYVYFWRWALRGVFEQRSGAAIVCFVSAASYVRGPAFVGMRCLLRHVLDELWLVDLEGDRRAARASHNLFPIRTPVAIGLGVRYAQRSTPTPASVRYTRLHGSALDKLSRLDRLQDLSDLEWQPVTSRDTFVPASGSAYRSWPELTELFPWQLSGAQLKRTWPIGPTPEVLRTRWQRLLELRPEQRNTAFGPTRDRDIRSSPPDLLDATTRLPALVELPADSACAEPQRYAYRAFDRHWVLPDARCGDFMRPSLWRVAGPAQVFVTSMLTNVLGPGPAAVATAHVPDLDHFRGSFGARSVIPLWRDTAGTRPNVDLEWLARLSARYGFAVTASGLMAYCYALLSACSYTRRFAEELRTPGPRVPLTRDADLFGRTALAGGELLAVHTYRVLVPGQAEWIRPVGSAYPRTYRYDASGEIVYLGDGQLGPVSKTAWAFGVSGYPVIGGWLRRRIKRRGKSPLDGIEPAAWSTDLTQELLALVWLVETTLARQPELDGLLDAAVSSYSSST